MTEDARLLDYLKRVTADLRRTRAELEDLRSRDSEPIAIVGMGCRLPGGADSPEALWRLLEDRVDAVGDPPTDRGWDLDALADRLGSRRWGGFLDDVAGFDADFFGISPREAAAMDPQQRLMLHVSWEAVERAGIDPSSLAGSPTGVFTGISVSDYAKGSTSGSLPVPEEAEGYLMTGTATSVASGRVAYTLGLEGPALTVDTACSSSLVAVHLAVRALRRSECSLALAGGATVMTGPSLFTEMARQGGLAADGRCKAFGAGADGAGFSEGAGALVLERLSDARRHGRRVLAVIRGSAINQDGASNGLTAPSGPAQVRVVRSALADAGLSAGDIDAVEAHGTGTELGDPIEAQALMDVFGPGRDSGTVGVGSLKSNIGHTQAAAGVAGVMKMVLSLQSGVLPRTLYADEPTPHVDWSSGRLRVLSEPRRWERGERVRRAGVSSFGVSGTNAHVIVEEAPEEVPAEWEEAGPRPLVEGPRPWVLSARTEPALREQAARLRAHLEGLTASGGDAPDASEVARALATTRTAFAHRAAVVGTGHTELMEGLRALADGSRAEGVVTGTAARGGRAVAPVFVFPGQGGQWVGMARGLLLSSEVFADAVVECEKALVPFVDWSLGAVLRGDPEAPAVAGEGARVDVVQPVLWAVMVSLARVWCSAGVEPAAVVGHSQGEIAAACVAGALTLEDGARVVALRSQALKELAGHGGMAALACAPERAAELIVPWRGRIGVAAVNGPESTVVSGDGDAITELVRACAEGDARVRRVDVDYASHSAQVERIGNRLRADLAGIRPRRGRVPFHSTVASGTEWTPGAVPAGEAVAGTSLDADYWYRNLRHPVLLAPVVDRVARQSDTFVEISPHPVLTLAIEQTLEDRERFGHVVLETLHRGRDEPTRFQTVLAEAHCRGVDVDWNRVLGGGCDTPPVELPTYPFQYHRYWLPEPRTFAEPAALGVGDAGHPLLGARVPVAGTGQTVFTGLLDVDRHPWLAEHALGDRALLPGTAMLELLLHVGRECGCPEVADLTLRAPVEVPPGENGTGLQIQIVVDPPDGDGARAVRVLSLPPGDDAWTLHAEGELVPETGEEPSSAEPPRADAAPLPVGEAYARFSALGYGYGPSFQGLRAAWEDGAGVGSEAELDILPDDAPGMAGPHPTLTDAGLHALLLHHLTGSGERRSPMPFAWRGVRLHSSAAPTRLRTRVTRTGRDTWSVVHADADGAPVLSIDRLTVREAPVAAEPPALFQQDWTEAAGPVGGSDARTLRTDTWATVGAGGPEGVTRYPDAAALETALEAGAPAPELVVVPAGGGDGEAPDHVRAELHRVLALLLAWVDNGRLGDTRIVVVTDGAVRLPDDSAQRPVDLSGAAVWGLITSAETENPGRFLLLDIDRPDTSLIAAAAATGEPRVTVRDGRLYVPRLAEARRPDRGGLHLPQRRTDWRLDVRVPGRIDGLAPVPDPDQHRALAPGEVRVAVRAAGVNFRDVLMTMGMHPGPVSIGHEGTGTVIGVGPDVDDLAPGDRVMGLFPGAFGPVAIARRGLVAPVPEGWDDASAAAVPAVYLTAYIALVEEAGLRAGEQVLVHSAAGGVGQAALHLARHLGARVLATASPEKWRMLREQGIAEEHLAHSRRLDFEERFRASAPPVDVVLNALTGEAIDASLRLMAPTGRFVELGHNELRDPERVASEHGGVLYRAFDLSVLPPERVQRAFAAILPLLEKGELPGVPVTRYPVERAVDAFRLMQQGRNVGKVVLGMATRFRPGGTVLVTGGTGTVGALVARHLVVRHGVTRLLLVGRRGAGAPGARELVDELGALGAQVTVASCDVADPEELRELLDTVPDDHPLTAVFHSAGVVDDATVTRIGARALERVLRPKVDGAWNLHTATADRDLDAFVLFSSAAGVLGSAGQGGYAAANSFMDALAHHRRSLGLPAQSLAWGRWADTSEATARLGDVETSRMTRLWGVEAIGGDEGCALMDAAADTGQALLLPVPMDLAGLRARATSPEAVPHLLRGLVRAREGRRSDAGSGAVAKLRAAGAGAERRALLEELVAARAAEILGYPSGHRVEADQDFLETGFDSLTVVELRNHLREATGLRLPAAVVFEHRTPALLAAHLDAEMGGGTAGGTGGAPAEPAGSAGAAGLTEPAQPADALVGLFRDTCADGRPEDAVAMVRAASRGRAVVRAEDPWPVEPVQLSTGPEEPVLVCFPSLVMTSGAQEFARFTAGMRGRRRVHVLPAPGFLAEERLPADTGVFVNGQADAALRAADGAPFVLVGRSSGGWVAHAVAEELHRRGRAPAGVVLLDTPVPGEPGVLPLVAASLPIVTESVMARASEFELLDAARLTAMGGYLGLFADWRPGPLPVPVTQVCPEEPVRTPSGEVLETGWEWPGQSSGAKVPGDHLTMLEEHAENTAAAVEEAVAGLARERKPAGRSLVRRLSDRVRNRG
ncbi:MULTISPECIES: type I polyketide synthase [Nocardiopsis]|uniref:Type I polyketide synthase n=1 Tax=Nocardiopsis sinuspersici TaxID=501010 RepID=A0A1V3BW40_9ACTN|nr:MULTISPECIES: type I polyketide synthase [Nocardiopsis]OOC52837.1 type I polyketide synthase [Nocardiopsis sinuspersici]